MQKYSFWGYWISFFQGLTGRRQVNECMDYSKEEFERLFKDSYRQMYRMAYSVLQDPDDAKDAVSQVFMQIWNAKPQISDASLNGYLLAAARNQALHAQRQKKIRQEMESEATPESSDEKQEERRELLERLNEVIEMHLSDQDRRILDLLFHKDMTYDEAARTLGISYAAVNKHITRSFSRIRNYLKIVKK